MRPSELEGINVVSSEAKIIGQVSGIEIDLDQWKVTDLRIQLSDEMIEYLGYKKPFLGHVEIRLAVDAVKSIADVVSINKPVTELREVIEPPR
jgi:sporulation protein YlmC with PRC-barrel domain